MREREADANELIITVNRHAHEQHCSKLYTAQVYWYIPLRKFYLFTRDVTDHHIYGYRRVVGFFKTNFMNLMLILNLLELPWQADDP